MAVEDGLASLAVGAVTAAAEDKTCKKCEHLTSKQLSIILTIGGGFHHGPCDTCKNGSNFKAKS
jgi:hypothetical protein